MAHNIECTMCGSHFSGDDQGYADYREHIPSCDGHEEQLSMLPVWQAKITVDYTATAPNTDQDKEDAFWEDSIIRLLTDKHIIALRLEVATEEQ